MKKLLAFVLACVLMLTTLCVPACADSYSLGDTYTITGLPTDDTLPDIDDDKYYWAGPEYTRGTVLLCEKDHEHTDSCYEANCTWTVKARQYPVGDKLRFMINRTDVEVILAVVKYANNDELTLIGYQPDDDENKWIVDISLIENAYISCDNSDRSRKRITGISMAYLIDGEYGNVAYNSWSELYGAFKSAGGHLYFDVDASDFDAYTLKSADDSETSGTLSSIVSSAIENQISDSSAAQAADAAREEGTFTKYCTACECSLLAQDGVSETVSICPVCGLVSDGTKLSAIEHAVVSGDEQVGELSLHMGELDNEQVVLTACFVQNGVPTAASGTVTVTVPMDFTNDMDINKVSSDGSETALDYTVDGDGCVSFTLTFDEGDTMALLHVALSGEYDASTVKSVF